VSLSDRPDAPGRGYAKGRARRAAIVAEASALFAERGFDATTILDLAAACDISRAGLLHHFPSKQSLLEAVLEARDAEDRARFTPYARGWGSIGVLRGMVDLAEHNQLVPGLIELFVRLSTEAASPDHPAHDYFQHRYERIRRTTAKALGAAVADGHLRPDLDAETAALRLTSLMDGLQLQWLLDRSVDMAGAIRGTLVEWMTPTGRAAFDACIPRSVPDPDSPERP
jgi:AcrR family transcriptional regulator